MNADFPRIITLLRKERKLSQKEAAKALGVSQALLSHYEKGIRECGLEFLVKTANFYNVSCDYLLGRSPEPQGATISYDDIPEDDPTRKEKVSPGGMMASFNKKLVINAVNALFSILQKCQCAALTKEISSFLMLSVYRMFRVVYGTNSQNDPRFFMVPEVLASGEAAGAMAVCESKAKAAAMGMDVDGQHGVEAGKGASITAAGLSEEYPNYASSLLNTIKNSEAQIQILHNSQK